MSITALPNSIPSMTPAQDRLLRIWVWFAVRPRFRLIVAAMLLCTLCSFINANTAWADDGTGSGSRSTYFFPLDGVVDTDGIAIDKYTTLPLDYGQATTPARLVRGLLMRLCWMGYTVVVYGLLAMTKFILDFQWLDWILSPFILLANSLQSVMSQTGIVSVGIAVSALVIAVAWGKGKFGSGFVQLLMVGLVIGLMATPIGNPSEQIKGWVTTASDYGKEAGAATVSEGNGNDELKDPVSGEIVDLSIRRPALTLAFGSDLESNQTCKKTFNDVAKGKADAEKIRKKVNGCDDAVKDANETDDFVIFAFFLIYSASTSGLLLLVGVFIFFIIKDVLMAGLGAVNVVGRSYLAVFPGGARSSFFNAFFQVLVNVVMIGVYIWLLAAYLWVMESITAAIGAANVMIGSTIFGFSLMVMAVTFFLFKKRAKEVARRLSQSIGSWGRDGKSTKIEPSKFQQTMGQGFKAAARGGSNLAKTYARNRATRKTAQMTTAALVAAITGGGSVAATRAATVGWSAAHHMRRPTQAVNDQEGSPSSTVRGPATQMPGTKTTSTPDPQHGDKPEDLRDENGAIPVRTDAAEEPREKVSGPTPLPAHHSSDAPEELQQGPAEQAAKNQQEKNAGTGMAAVVPTPPSTTNAGERQENTSEPKVAPAAPGPDSRWQQPGPGLPAAQYGRTHVNTDGSVNRSYAGDPEIVETIPKSTRTRGTWDTAKGPDQDPVKITSMGDQRSPAPRAPRPQAPAPASSAAATTTAPASPPVEQKPAPGSGFKNRNGF